MSTRRAARSQPLPEQEAQILNQLDPTDQKLRAADLYHAGWTLRAIGEALYPPRSRSTVRSWLHQDLPARLPLQLPTPTAPQLRTTPAYVPKRPLSPGIDPATNIQIGLLAVEARKFRSGMASTSLPATSNASLTHIVRDLHARNVSVRELAAAAGVTYRAMARRLGKGV